jgi:uncharacterized Fe-S radical SAM superfamily protein PflX
MTEEVKHSIEHPSYIALSESGELEERICQAYALLSSCTVCPRKCRINRLEDERGFCRTGILPVISSFGPHFGEETPLVGKNGSGTIFVTHCTFPANTARIMISASAEMEKPSQAKHWQV